MTTMVDRFFGVSQHVIRCGLFSEMREGEIRLYVCLMYESERCTTRKLTLTDAQIREIVGAAGRTVCNARKRLQEFGLIKYESIPGKGYVYIICDPVTHEPYPGDPKKPIVYQKKSQVTPKTETDLTRTPILAETPKHGSSVATGNRVKNKDGDNAMNEHGLTGVFDTSDEPRL